MSIAEAHTDGTVAIHDGLWSQRVGIISDKLYRLWPEDLHGRLGAGTAIAQHPKRFRVTDGGLQVADLDDKKWYTVNGSCECEDYPVAQQGFCKHRTAAHIFQEARELPAEALMSDPATVDLTTGEVLNDAPVEPGQDEWEREDAGPGYRLPPQFFTLVQGVKCVKYAGLLRLAHQHGLQSLEADWTLNEEKLSLARAVACFQDGRRFVEQGDSTPENAKRVKDAWRRLSLTRAKARCLRDALGIYECSVEEME